MVGSWSTPFRVATTWTRSDDVEAARTAILIPTSAGLSLGEIRFLAAPPVVTADEENLVIETASAQVLIDGIKTFDAPTPHSVRGFEAKTTTAFVEIECFSPVVGTE